MSSQIKGGGLAILSSECRQAIVSLLMQLESSATGRDVVNDGSCSILTVDVENSGHNLASSTSTNSEALSSKLQQERLEHEFVARLVQRYEFLRLTHQYNNSNNNNNESTSTRNQQKNHDISNSNNRSLLSATDTTMHANNGNHVRIEIADAFFKTSNKESSSKQKHTQLHSTSKSHELPFQSRMKKVVVLPRSTTIKDLCRQAKDKFRIKAKSPFVRAFVVHKTSTFTDPTTETTPFFLIDLKNDLSRIQDGTIVYVTATTEDSTMTVDKNKKQETDFDIAHTHDVEQSILTNYCKIDPLEQVKQAYAHLHNQRRISSHSTNKEQVDHPIIDSNLVAKWAVTRANLPATACKSDILLLSKTHRVVILSGDTGCGKSTQVPQFLYEYHHGHATTTATTTEDILESSSSQRRRMYIVVTQPRQVATISLARRVAEEMGCPPPGAKGSLVGHIVRLDRRVNEDTCRIIYCTVGVLLRMLVCPRSETHCRDDSLSSTSQPPLLSLDTISHLILDEVHERDVNTDFCLTLLRGMLKTQQYPHLRLMLMSATASVDFLVNYFASVVTPTTFEIPGRTFSVQTNWLPDCERLAGMTLQDTSGYGQVTNATSFIRGGIESVADGPRLSPRAHQKIDNKLVLAIIKTIIHQQEANGDLDVSLSCSSTSTEKNYRETGAILVFLPGKAEIEALAKCLYEDRTLATIGDRRTCRILKLYSSMPRNEQQNVFQPTLTGTAKIVLATNVAETSVTIPDVSHVIDTGRVKESRFNASSRIKEVVTVWISQASAKQRSGRAGRTSDGTCWRLYSQEFFEKEMTPETAPEMVRTPLDELILQICLLYEQRRDDFFAKKNVLGAIDSGSSPTSIFPMGVRPAQFLSKTPSPPPLESLMDGCRHLLQVDALRVVRRTDEDPELSMYRLTPLGYHLSRLPMDAKVGKVLIVGCILGCLDGALTVAAALSCTKSCFLVLGNNHPDTPGIVQARKSLLENGFGGPMWPGGTVKGDLIAVIAVFRAWQTKETDSHRWEFCKSHGLGMATLRELDRQRAQFLVLLGDAGIVPRSPVKNSGSFDSSLLEDYNQASDDALLTSCCLVAGLYPNVCTLMRPRKGGPRAGRLLTKEGDECRPQFNSFQHKRVQEASEGGRDAYAVFHSKHKIVGIARNANAGSGGRNQPPLEVFLTEVNFVSRFALLLFGSELHIVKNAIFVDGWLKFKVTYNNGDNSTKDLEASILLLSLRELMDKVLSDHVLQMNASKKRKQALAERHKAVIQVIRKLLAEES